MKTLSRRAWTAIGIVALGVLLCASALLPRIRDTFAGILNSSNVQVTRSVVTATKLSSTQAVSPFFNPLRNALQYYERGTGRVLEVQPDGSGAHTISDTQLPGFTSSTWSPDGHSVASSFSTGDGTTWKLYRFDTDQTFTLPRGTQAVAFSPDSNRLAYFQTTSTGSSVSIVPAIGGTPKQIFATHILTASVAWPQENIVAVTLYRSSGEHADVFLVDLDGSVTHLIDDQISVETNWAPGGAAVLVSLTNPSGNPELWVRNTTTGTYSILPFAAPASRCAWSLDAMRVFCAIPHEGRGAPYDDFREIDLGNGSVSDIADGADLTPHIEAQELLLSPDERRLVTVNQDDGLLYSIPLP